MTEKEKKEYQERHCLSDKEIDELSGGSGFNTSGDEPLYAVGQSILFMLVTNVNSMAMPTGTWFEGTIAEVLGKEGSFFPEFRYKVKDNNQNEYEVWEGEITAK